MQVMHDAVDPSLFAGGAGIPPPRNGLAVRFYKEPVQDMPASEREGRPVYTEVDYIEIAVPGDKTNIVCKRVGEQHKREYAQQWAAYKAGDSEQVVGTPLSQWPGISRAQVKELEFFRCRTVEQLAELSDTSIGAIGPIRRLRDNARAYLEAANGFAPVTRLQGELEKAREELAAMKQQIQDLQAATKKGR
jgi:hypothetical protein